MKRFPEAAREALGDETLQRNLAHATATIREKRAAVVAELPDWEELREAGRAIKERTLLGLDRYLVELESAVERAGGRIHWARDAAEANETVIGIAQSRGVTKAVKVKSILTDEIGLNEALAARSIDAVETDFAELILQLDRDWSSHILVPAIHRNRAEIREIFREHLPGAREVSDEPAALAEASRRHLRRKFLDAELGLSGANFLVAETGSVVVVESEGNGRMCTTLPDVLVAVAGIEKVVPTWDDLEVFLQLLPRSSTGERMNPYTSVWTGVTPGDGPREFHLVLVDNGRTRALADAVGREALACIRCSACLNVCPVYERSGGHAYGSVYPGPIGAVLTPQLRGVKEASSLPYASSLCGACYDACPVKIDIPRLLVHLRGHVVEESGPSVESAAMRALGQTLASRRRYELAQKVARAGRAGTGVFARLPGPLHAWAKARAVPGVPKQTFREWWRAR